jgi:ATP-binding cassette subfamily B protein
VWFIALLYLSNLLRLSDYIPFYLTKLGIVQCSNDFLLSLLEKSNTRSIKNAVSKGHIKFEDVEFKYSGSRAPVLLGFHLEVQPGEKIGILGTSGSGKTTAMKLLSGMYTPTSGLLQIDGHSVHTIDLQHLRRQIVYINQRTQLFNMSILKNIQYGNKVSAKEVGDLLKRYKLETVYAKLPQGIYTNAGVNGSSLSLGMQKITMLMRGLLRNGKVIILDEPLAGLDASTRVKVMQIIKDKCSGKTTLVITHDKEIIPYMDRVVNISEINKSLNHTKKQSPLDSMMETFLNWTA